MNYSNVVVIAFRPKKKKSVKHVEDLSDTIHLHVVSIYKELQELQSKITLLSY